MTSGTLNNETSRSERRRVILLGFFYMVALSKILSIEVECEVKRGIGLRKAVRACWDNRANTKIRIKLNFILT